MCILLLISGITNNTDTPKSVLSTYHPTRYLLPKLPNYGMQISAIFISSGAKCGISINAGMRAMYPMFGRVFDYPLNAMRSEDVYNDRGLQSRAYLFIFFQNNIVVLYWYSGSFPQALKHAGFPTYFYCVRLTDTSAYNPIDGPTKLVLNRRELLSSAIHWKLILYYEFWRPLQRKRFSVSIKINFIAHHNTA